MRLLIALVLLGQGLVAQDTRDVNALNQEVERLYSQGKYAEAVPIAEQSLALNEKNRGPGHPDTATSLNNLAGLYQAEGAHRKAEPLYQRALAIRERALGPENPDTAAILNNLAGLYYAEGAYQKAEPLFLRALAITEKTLGPNHLDTATRLNNLAQVYQAEGAYPKAEPLYQRALTIMEGALGPDHVYTARALNNLAGIYYAEGAYQKADPLFQRVVAIFEKGLGPDHPSTATSLNNLGELYRAEGLYQKAEVPFQRALAIFEKALGPDHPGTAISLHNLAGLYYAEGAYAKAEPLYQRALAIKEKALGPNHPDTATSLNDLAYLYRAEGEYHKAEPLYQRALTIREKALGPDHPDTAASLDNLAGLYLAEGAYRKAEPLHLRALAILEKALGPDHPDTAAVLSSLANLHRMEGSYQKAEPLLQRALTIREKALGPDHPDTATSLSDLAGLYLAERAYAKAEPLFQRALTIREKTLGPDHPGTAASLSNFAELYQAEGAYQKAEPLLQRALTIREKALGPDHPDTAASLNNLAGLYDAAGAYPMAEPLFQRALAMREKALGPDHPDTAASLNNLAGLYQAEGAYTKAEPLYRRVLAIDERTLGPDHPNAVLHQQNLTLLYCKMGDWSSAAAALPHLIRNQSDRWDLSFGRDSQRQHVTDIRKNLIAVLHAGSLLPDQRRVYLPLLLETILTSKARVTEEERVVLEVLTARGTTEDRALVQELEDTINSIGALNQQGPGIKPLAEYRKEHQGLEMRESDLRAQLSVRSAELRAFTAEPSPQKIAAGLHDRVLVEFVRTEEFHPGAKSFGDSLYAAVVLFPDGHIDMAELGPAKPIDELIATYRQAQEVIDNREQAEALAGKLGDAILGPIARLTGSRTEWWVAADGELRQLPLNALRLNGKYAVERYHIWPIGSGRDLLTLDSRPQGLGNDLIIANPDFGKGTAFTALSETEDEAEAIGELLPNARIVDPANRTKTFLLNLKTPPRILHLSTHAFYHPGEGDPTLRSGIALNGANLGPDGILTAKEAQTLRLNGTQLVVMSACDTGVGEVSFGDGLVGLQRSLTLAGARTQVLTEWPVNSAGTRDFMVRFYAKLAAGETKGDAWIDTQRDLIREGVAPHFWAPFVLYGDPGPLTGK